MKEAYPGWIIGQRVKLAITCPATGHAVGDQGTIRPSPFPEWPGVAFDGDYPGRVLMAAPMPEGGFADIRDLCELVSERDD